MYEVCCFDWSESYILILASNLDLRSAHFYGQFSLDKIGTLQASWGVLNFDMERGFG